MWVVGIDPGRKGGVAIIEAHAAEVEVFPMPHDIRDLADRLEPYREDIIRVFVEKQHPVRGQGLKSTSRLMHHYGQLIGMLRSLKIPFEEIPPRRWQRHFFGNGKRPRKRSKQESLCMAKDMYPSVANLIGDHDGMADAVCIAEFGRQMLWFKAVEMKRRAFDAGCDTAHCK